MNWLKLLKAIGLTFIVMGIIILIFIGTSLLSTDAIAILSIVAALMIGAGFLTYGFYETLS